MALEIGDKKRALFMVAMVVVLGLAAFVWYPRLFGAKTRVRVQPTAPPPLLIVEPQKPAAPPAAPPAAAKAPAAPTAKPAAPKPGAPERAPAAAKAPAAPKAAEATPSEGRYGLEFPPFATLAEAEEFERKLKDAGLPTLRTSAETDAALYTLVVGPFSTAARATEVLAELRARAGTSPREAEGGFVASDGPYVLREVVLRALEAKAKGHGVRVLLAEGKAPAYVLRTASRLDGAQAEKLSSHYQGLGFPNAIVSAR